MSKPTQCDVDIFRVLLYRNDAAELLVGNSRESFRIPEVAIPVHTRVAEEITSAIKSRWDLETYCLFSLPRDGAATAPRYQVAEICRPEEKGLTGMRWVPVGSLSIGRFENSPDFAAIEKSLTTLGQYRRNELPGIFGKPGWLRTVMEWVEVQAGLAGLRLTGKFRQLNASPTFSLVRFETDGPALWFKAVGEPNLREYPITLKLAASFPEFVPRVLAARRDWNTWLTFETEGSSLEAASPAEAWETAAESLAKLQIASLGRRFELIDAGCKDRRPCTLRNLVVPFFDSMAELMTQQIKRSPAPLSQHQLSMLGQEVIAALEELEGEGVPSSLGHLDMNPGNVLISASRCVFLDWAEAHVGPPFFSFQYLTEHYRRLKKEDPPKEFLASYTKVWEQRFSLQQIRASLRLTPLLAAFTYAAGVSAWHSPQTISAETAVYLRSLVRRMKREADLLRESKLVCAP
jgi:Phosphotransferase enzyme family